jgi:hypothetical protein
LNLLEVERLDEAVTGLGDGEEDALHEGLRGEGVLGIARRGLPLLGERVGVAKSGG